MTNSSDLKELHWFVAYVRSCQERNVAAGLSELGYEYYLPVRREVRQWSDRKKIVERLLLPRMVFVHCNELQRRKSLEEIPYLYSYINNGGPFKPAIVRDVEMDTFRAMVERSDRPVSLRQEPLSPGDHVRVVTGPLEGMECELVSVEGRRCLAVRLGALGTATIDLAVDTVKKITEN